MDFFTIFATKTIWNNLICDKMIIIAIFASIASF